MVVLQIFLKNKNIRNVLKEPYYFYRFTFHVDQHLSLPKQTDLDDLRSVNKSTASIYLQTPPLYSLHIMCTSQERTRLCADCLVINKSNIYRIFINSIILCIYFAKGSAVSAFVIYSRLPVIYLALGLLLIFFVGLNVNVLLWSPLHANVAKYNTCTCRLLYVN